MRRITNLLIRSRMRLYTIDPAGVVPKIPMGGIAAPNEVSRGSELQAKIVPLTGWPNRRAAKLRKLIAC